MPTSPSAPNFGFTDYAQELQNVERRRQFAQALMQQGLEPTQQQPAVGGIVTPISPMAGLAQLAKVGVGAAGMSRSEQKAKEVSQKYQSDLAQALYGANSAMKGTPSIQPDPQEIQQAADQGMPTPQASQPQAPDMSAAIQSLMSHPETAPIAIQMQTKMMGDQLTQQKLQRIMGMGNPMTPGQGSSVMAGAAGPSGGQNMMSGIPPQIMAMITSDDPAIQKLGTSILEANKGVAQRANAPLVNPLTGQVISQPVPIPTPGTQVNVTPQGNVVTPIPGALPAASAFTQAQAEAKGTGEARTQIESGVTDAQGRPVYPSKASLLGLENPPAVPAPTPISKPQPAPGSVPLPRFGQTTAQREAQAANEKHLAEEAAKGREAANVAIDTNFNLQQVLQHSREFDTGRFASTFMGARSYLQAMAPNLFPEEEMNKLSNFQELNKYSKRLGFDMARKMGARESTQIVEMSIEANPNPEMVRPAIESISHGLMAQNDYVIAKEKARDNWRDQHNGTLSGFNSNWQQTADPMAFLLKYQTPQEQTKLFSTMSASQKQKLLQGLQALRAQGIL